MKKLLIVFLILFTIGILSANEKIIKIGDFNWYTEQNSFNDIVKVAQKVDKPILAVFSATWCAPCKSVKKRVFENKEFSKVEKLVVLLYIEETTSEGKVYNKQNKIKGWPSFKLFSKDGVLLDGALGNRSVDGFLSWIDKVKAGDNYYELSKKILKNPQDRKSLIAIVDKMGHGGSKEKLGYLKRALKINSDFNDDETQKAYEKIMGLIIANIPYKGKKEIETYISSNKSLIDKIINTYYPSKFKYEFKGAFGLFRMITWYNKAKEYKKAADLFNDFLKSKKGELDLPIDMLVIRVSFESLLHVKKYDLANKLLKKIDAFSLNKEVNKQPKYFIHPHSQCYASFLDYYGKLNEIKKAETYAKKYFELIEQIGNKRYLNSRFKYYALEYGIFAEKTIKILLEESKTLNGEHLARSLSSVSKLYNKINDKKNAKKIILDYYNNKELTQDLDSKTRARILNTIAWRLYENKMEGKLSLKIVKESINLNVTPYSLDTLANIQASLSDFKGAIATEKKAIKLTVKDDDKKMLIENIKKWEKKIKK